MNTITIEQIMDYGPFRRYTLERVKELWAGREAVTALDILDMDIPAADKLWAVLRNWCFDDRTLLHLAADFAEMVLPNFEAVFPDDNRPRLAIQATRDFADGKIDHAAWAAWAAAEAATLAAVQAAADAAAWAARAAAWAADAADVAEAAALAASWKAEAAARAAQIARVRQILTDHDGVHPGP